MNAGAGRHPPVQSLLYCYSDNQATDPHVPPLFTANGNDSKKFKGDIRSPGIPSRVIHVRKLPNDINEAEVISLGLPFGKVTNLLMLKGKNQVLSNTEHLRCRAY